VPHQVPLLYLDANVLLPVYLRAVFLDLADAGLVRVHWGAQVLVEVRRNLLKPKFGVTPEAVDKLFDELHRAFPDALVPGSETLEAQFRRSTDPKDAHVAAGALHLSHANPGNRPVLLVTSNIKHLPQAAFEEALVRPVKPGVVLKELLSAEPAVAEVLEAMLKRFRNPTLSKVDLLDILDASNCRAFATALGHAWGFDSEGSATP
jgi:hypothetical protein